MPFNGSGSFAVIYNWTQDKANAIKVRADRMDGQDADIATGLSTAICKDGQTTITANLPMSTFKHTGVGLATNATDYLRADQLQSQNLTYFTTAGSADAYTLTPSPVVAAYAAGQTWKVKISATNLTTTPTIAVSGLSAITIANGDLTAVAIGQLVIGGVYDLTYESSVGKFLLPNIGAGGILTNGGVKNTAFVAAVNNRYRVRCTTADNVVRLPSGTAGDLLLLVAYGSFNMGLCGTVNGATSTIYVPQQSLWLGYTSTAGWT